MKRKLKESEFTPIPAGEQVVRIKEIDDSEYQKFDKLTVTVEDVGGRTARVNFNFVDADGNPNDVAEGIYTRMCRAAMNDQTLDEVDTRDLIGKFVTVEIVHNEGSKGGTFANVKKWIGPGEPFATGSRPAGSTSAAAPAGGERKKTAAEILEEMRAKKAAAAGK
jgi:hypothetical protein